MLTMHFRHRKVTPELVEFMKSLRNNDTPFKQIAKTCNLSSSSVQYHLNPKCRADAITRENKRYYENPKVREYQAQKRRSQSRKDWNRNYLHDRYTNDPEFRKKMIRANSGGRFADKWA